jgi:hypothetical protein
MSEIQLPLWFLYVFIGSLAVPYIVLFILMLISISKGTMKFREWLHWLSLNLQGREAEARAYAIDHDKERKE